MKKLILFLVLVCFGRLSASAMGHPHNLFSVHQKAKQYAPKSKEGQRSACRLSKRSLIEYVRALAG
ncbi:hypothetical protein [Larkinella arboricola]|uniref:Uncharacterized protein n=1 Tax=Larkinella arboricola TaxID=643671 RepID=A0A327XAB1_LARAB|nr:hypothetical protein [Larkinella arboricola]RAK02783.1 hypothetical protein LX87_00903 [Larkinella arboricola]